MLDGYEIVEALFESERTVVFLARSREKGTVVLKSCRDEYPGNDSVARVHNEHRILKLFDSPRVVKVIGMESPGGRPVLILEHLCAEGMDRQIVDGSFEFQDFIRIACEVTKALRDVHDMNVIHKDIKPDNIMILPDRVTVKLIDFNISTVLLEEWQTAEGPEGLEGTLRYISPEQTGRMNRKVDYRTDFYSLGVVFYEMLAGQPPFVSKDPLELVHDHIAKAPPDLRGYNDSLPESLYGVIDKLLAKNSEDRYRGARGL